MDLEDVQQFASCMGEDHSYVWNHMRFHVIHDFDQYIVMCANNGHMMRGLLCIIASPDGFERVEFVLPPLDEVIMSNRWAGWHGVIDRPKRKMNRDMRGALNVKSFSDKVIKICSDIANNKNLLYHGESEV